MSAARITRREIKRDELVTTVGTLTHIVERHARSIGIAAIAVVVLIAAVSAGVWYSRSRDRAAIARLGAVQRSAAAPVAGEGGPATPGGPTYLSADQKYSEVLRLADDVIREHPSTRAAQWAAYWKAVAQKELGRHADAIATLAPLTAATEDEFLSCTARILEGQVKEAQGDLAAAAEIYAALAASAPARFPAEIALMNQARLLEKQGRTEEAMGTYRRITQEYPDSPFAREASQRLSSTRG